MAKNKQETMSEDTTPVSDLPVTNTTPSIDMDALRSAIKEEILAALKKESETKMDPGFSRPGVRTVTQEAIAQTVVQAGTLDMDAPAAPKSQTQIGDGTIRQDF